MIAKYKEYIIATVIMVSIVCLGVLIGSGALTRKDVKDSDYTLNKESDIVSTIPQESALNFVYHNATIGNQKALATFANLSSGYSVTNVDTERVNAYKNVETALIYGSPLIGNQVNYSYEYFKRMQFATFWEVDELSLVASETYNERQIEVVSELGLHEYNAVDVNVSFTSNVVAYTHDMDSDWDGNYVRMVTPKSFKDMTITLVEVDGKWFIYDMPNAEEEVNIRFATWKGISPATVDEGSIESGIIYKGDK